MRAIKELFTAEELERLSSSGKRMELVKGKVYEMAPAGGRHGWVAMNAGTLLSVHVWQLDLGTLFATGTGFVLRRNPDTVRAPDVAFISSAKMALEDVPDGFIETIPDLVVEVVSPGDSRREVREKVEDWLRAGVRLVWVLFPATRTATVYRSVDDVTELSEDDALDGGDVVPGFSCSLREVFG